jgi:anti-sigma B factor antagonist
VEQERGEFARRPRPVVESLLRPRLDPPPAQTSSPKRSDLAEVHESGASLHQHPVLSVESQDGGACVVRLAGELDLYNANDVREALLNACADHPERLVVDLGKVDFVDSTALGVLIEARTRLANKHAFLLAAPRLETRRALEISGLDRHFSVHESVPAALATRL